MLAVSVPLLVTFYLSIVSSSFFEPIHGTNEYVSYYPGDSPIIILSQHGGSLKPDNIPDREHGCMNETLNDAVCLYTYTNGTSCPPGTVRDPNNCTIVTLADSDTKELAKCIRNNTLLNIDGKLRIPHFVVSNLHRSKLDPNRELDIAAQGNIHGEIAHNELHNIFMEDAKNATRNTCGFGIIVDIHGQSKNEWNQLGYRLSQTELLGSDSYLNSRRYKNSIQYLVTHNENSSLVDIIKGNHSLGEMIYSNSKQFMVPSKFKEYLPNGVRYYMGGYSLNLHGSEHGGVVDAIQIEANETNRKDDLNREKFCHDFSEGLIEWIEYWYNLNNCSYTTSSPTGDTSVPYDVPTPAPTGPTNVPTPVPTNPTTSPTPAPTGPTASPTPAPIGPSCGSGCPNGCDGSETYCSAQESCDVCVVDPCMTARCGSGTQCKSSYCGGCIAICEASES